MGSGTKGRFNVFLWGGISQGADRKTRISMFLGLLIVLSAMTFVQFGFVGVGFDQDYSCYVLALLGPIAVASLVLGAGWGALEGVLAGAVLFAHAQRQPLDIIEKYFINPISSIVLYGLAGLVLGLLFAIALRNNPKGIRRWVYIAIPCALVAILTTVAFELGMLFVIEENKNMDVVQAFLGTGIPLFQPILDFLLMFVLCVLANWGWNWYVSTRTYISVRTIFRVRLLCALFLVFLTMSAVCFAVITLQEEASANESITAELDYLQGQLDLRSNTYEELLKQPEVKNLPDSILNPIDEGLSVDGLIKGYDLTDGTIVLFVDGTPVLTDNPTFDVDAFQSHEDYEELKEYYDALIKNTSDRVKKSAESSGLILTVYNDGSDETELGYMKGRKINDTTYLMFSRPFSMVFAHRTGTLLWTSLMVLVLLVVVYLVVANLLKRVIIKPVDNTNASMAKIMAGNLDELVCEVGSVEFASLSAGINSTVDALKVLIDEAERRNERDLATARAIQIGALPKAFPAFPDNQKVDLYAAMDAAKEVGGDFYDFFEIDEHRVGFLIADVSGKGIPGALFMMAAKAEIQNYLASGMEPAKAIASANAYLCANNEAGMFVTVWAATLDWTTGELTYVNAGHNFPLLRHGRNGSWEWLKKKCGLFLGTFDIAKYRQETIMLEPGDELVLYTDGVNEAFNLAEEEYGNDQLEEFLAAHSDMRPNELVPALRDDVARWAEGAEQSDDVTILVVEYDA